MLKDNQQRLFVDALGAMAHGPRPIHKVLTALSEPEGDAPSEDVLRQHFLHAPQDDPALNRFRRQLVGWDAAEAPWTKATARNTEARRSKVYELLGLGRDLTQVLNARLPFAPWLPPTVIAVKHRRWYSDSIREGREFYWVHYRDYLARQGRFSDVALERLDEATNLVVERLADPRQPEAYRSKGLVVGYVQSGKTANFTGVIAKGIDAGYRLIIVLSGTTNLLRNQTQRRIDRELVGVEQIRPAGATDSSYDYASDPDWDEFISYGRRPSEIGSVDIIRLTGAGSSGDFQSLRHGIKTLQFEKRERNRPLYDPSNLQHAGARLLIVKKNSTVLKRLSRDMNRIGEIDFREVPALIIDDESDQASINTAFSLPVDLPRRTTINTHIRELLAMLPRGQYVGYTATPVANVFVSPEDSLDIFPKDFIISLPRPDDYMGVSDFHDLDNNLNSARATAGESNEVAYIRGIPHRKKMDDDRMQEAIDTFVLTGALKLYRKRLRANGDFRHHTMLVHETQLQADQSRLAQRIRSLWSSAGYEAGPGLERLRTLYRDDIQKVSAYRAGEQPLPQQFDDLLGDIGEAIRKVDDNDGPVYIVNGSESANDPDFDSVVVWKILVGGAKLSRGYTVEGLTVSYFRRRSTVQDTLMQMGRWFGFRPGYRDLIRLYIGRNEAMDKTGRRQLDLYELFGAVCKDEEAFRSQLARYAMPSDGSDPITPQQVPPLVLNSHPQLRPTAKSKMFNAVMTAINKGGEWIERTLLADEHVAHNAKVFSKLLAARGCSEGKLEVRKKSADGINDHEVPGFTCIVPHKELVEALRSYRWAVPNLLRLEIEFLEGKSFDPEIDDWLVILPQLRDRNSSPWRVGSYAFTSVERSRVSSDGRFKAFSDPGHRSAVEVICGVVDGDVLGEFTKALFRRRRRGGLLLYPTYNRNGSTAHVGDPHLGMAILPPLNGHHALAHFTVKNSANADAPIVPLARSIDRGGR